MPQTVFIDTNTLPREQAPGGGTLTEILNARLAGANNVSGSLRRPKRRSASSSSECIPTTGSPS
jgi:hypothetical protein